MVRILTFKNLSHPRNVFLTMGGIEFSSHSFALLLLVSMDLSAGSLPHPGGYDQCVSDAMKGITSPRAADSAMLGCREKFPDTKRHDANLPPDVLGKLIVHAGFGYGIFSGSLYNGNNDYTVTGITVLLTPGKKNSAEAYADGKEYEIDLTVQPLSKSALSMPIPSDNTQEYLWKITKARGYKTR